ncbi:hypothetical protein [Sphingomonas sp. PR090111-T3T-6A]|uniref:hypothetical protein n=1 Tax=Sphingomonas sp. PR090111-T3T-6A TaxID=685778 RepID=UPI0012F94D9A|nr:hypothetical protein [Sphingomonas sp. PR090111-T3T-6A]
MQFRRIHLLLVPAFASIGTLPAPLRAEARPVATTAPRPDCDAGRDGASRCRAAQQGHAVSPSGEAKANKNDASQAKRNDDDDGPIMTKGLKVWITRGGSYCIREIAVDGKLRCQSEAAWAKEGVTFTRTTADRP